MLTFANQGVRCLSSIRYKYNTKLFNVSINFPTYVTFGLRNVSFSDSGWYYAIDTAMYFMPINSSGYFGKRKLLVGDTILRICALKQMEFEFVLPLSVSNETVAVVFYSEIDLIRYIISICNPEAGTCVPPPRATFPRFECIVIGSRITTTLTSVQIEDGGIYALIGSTSRIAYQSAVLNVIECAFTAAAFDVEFNNTDLTTIYAAVNNTGTLYSRAILSSSSPITDNSFENYFVGGGVVAGMAIVILICWFVWKRCYTKRGNGAGDDDYNTVDVHYYCSIRNQNEHVTQSEATTGSVPESQQFSAVMD
ncbi:hypothetical protein ACJMK2_025166 [Sinanodonta woodiana]|uniref:Uncharacterized protein n=1 Tax=Sinanodonta woodiana TaxID=1069815 RepID=A0ABD3XJC2_SINWO